MAEHRDDEERKEDEIVERTAPTGDIVYQAVYREGEHELERDSRSLAWSGLAAGISMGFSMVCEAMLRAHLPEAPWQPLISKLGYTIGFLIVILGRQQLFTKNTLTVILPLLKKKSPAMLSNVARLWTVVLVANLFGVCCAAALLARTPIVDSQVHAILAASGHEAVDGEFSSTLLRAILAGWFIALMVWLLPYAESARVWVIIILAYFVGLGHFSHVIAGGGKAFFVVATGEVSIGHALGAFLVPTLIGNIVGGVSLVAALAHVEFTGEQHE